MEFFSLMLKAILSILFVIIFTIFSFGGTNYIYYEGFQQLKTRFSYHFFDETVIIMKKKK